MKRIRFVLFLFCIITFFSSTILAQKQPNFIFILTDDQPFGYMGCTGNTIIQTPNIDNLAKNGVLFTNAHITSAICTPSRTSILLSQYERKHGINFNSGTSLSMEGWKQAYPMVMKEHGYYIGWIGKNHVPVGKGGYESGVMEESFDYWYGGHRHLGFYPKDRHEIFKSAKHDTQVEVLGEGIEDFLSNELKLVEALDFIDSRPENKPFMLSVCFNLPHDASAGSMKMKPSDDEMYKSLYRDKEISLPMHYVAKKDIKNPKLPLEIHHVENRQEGYDYVDEPGSTKERYIRQLQSITGIDKLVGELRQALKDKKLDENTIIVFTSDHGLFMGQFGLGGKAFCYEVATHVPMLIYDPTSPVSVRGRNSSALVQSIDIAPTMLAIAGIPIPESYQGYDLSGLLNGKKKEVRTHLYTENLWSTQFGNPRCEAVQNTTWKYIRYYRNDNFSANKKVKIAKEMGIPVSDMLYKIHDPEIAIYRDYIESPLLGEPPVYEELYNLKNDPDEVINLVQNPEYSKTLSKMRKVWEKEIIAARGEGPLQVLRYTVDSKPVHGHRVQSEK